MKNNKWILLLLACTALFVASCDDDDYNYDSYGVYLGTPEVTSTSMTSASINAKISIDSNVLYTAVGFCYSTSSTPTIYDATSTCNIDGNTISDILIGLSSYTTYYVRAFVCTYQGGVSYSEEVTFVTGENEELASYVAPSYDDDYTSVAAWDSRSSWNLANVHDPSVVLADDGYYYMYQTDASYGNAHEGHGHFHARRSTNLIDWEYLGATMNDLPSWITDKLNEIREEMGLSNYVQPDGEEFGYWAPCVRKVNSGLYRMYYSIVVPGYLDGTTNSWGERAFIGLMENSDPSNNSGWVDKGYVITNASDRGLNFNVSSTDYANCYYKWNAIDPTYIITDSGEHWLIYGSWHSGMAAVQLDSSTGLPKESLGNPWGTEDDIAAYGTMVATREMGNRWQGSEGPEVIYRNGYYYMFLAYDELSVAYNTRVVRSENINGPYVGIDGTDVTNNGGEAYPIVTHPYKFNNSYGWVGISHCAVFDDGNDNWYFASQGRFPADIDGIASSNALMMGQVRSIRWTNDGWPLVMPERYGAVPQITITSDELIGNWENIDLSYSYAMQKTPETLTLDKDGTVSAGTWSGSTWSFDEEQQILTIDGVDLYVQRETDWEASPRTHTIVFAGYDGTSTYWGKKSK